MSLYMVHRELPGIQMDQLAAAQRAAIDQCSEFGQRGRQVRYIRSMFLPGEERCMCLFEAGDRQTVKEVNDAAKLPYSGISEALELNP